MVLFFEFSRTIYCIHIFSELVGNILEAIKQCEKSMIFVKKLFLTLIVLTLISLIFWPELKIAALTYLYEASEEVKYVGFTLNGGRMGNQVSAAA